MNPRGEEPAELEVRKLKRKVHELIDKTEDCKSFHTTPRPGLKASRNVFEDRVNTQVDGFSSMASKECNPKIEATPFFMTGRHEQVKPPQSSKTQKMPSEKSIYDSVNLPNLKKT